LWEGSRYVMTDAMKEPKIERLTWGWGRG
jgi:hypothetical protein